MMNMRVPSRSLTLSSLLAVAALTFGGCIIPGNVGEDPDGGDDDPTAASTSVGSATSNGHTSADPSVTATVTTTSGWDSATSGWDTVSTVTTIGGSEVDGAPTTAGPVDEEEALLICGVPMIDVEPGGQVFIEAIQCADGCYVEIESGEQVDLYNYGECICEVMQCGPLAGGTVGSGFPPDTDGSTTDPTGEVPPDGCGPFPPGMESFTCNCEICSIDVNDVDSEWLANEANLPSICACMCGNTGCGMPI